MAFNIWERWPWTSFQNLNLDWLMKAVKEAVTKAQEASDSVGQFDNRITANENAIDQLEDDLGTISSPVRVFVNSDLEAFYRGQHITGVELKAMLQTHGDLPYVEFNGEVYMLDSVSNAGDLRFSMGHTSGPVDDDLVIRHIMIPAQSYSCAYSISNIGSGGGSSGNVFAVVVRSQSGGYVADHTYSEILSQMQNGRVPILLVVQGAQYESCPMARVGSSTSGGQTVDYVEFADTSWMVSNSNNIGSWRIYSDGTVSRLAPFNHLATLDNIIQMVNDGVTTDALLKTAQTLSAAEQAQVKQNLGITSGESSGMTQIPITVSGGVYSTNMTAADLLNHLHTNGCFAVVNGLYYVPVGSSFSGVYGNIYFQSVVQSEIDKTDVEVLRFYMHGEDAIVITAYDRDIPLLTAPPIVDTATGDPASITDGANHYPIKSLIANIDTVQSGSGDPSPTNVRPITGWNAIEITKTTSSGSNSYTVAIPSAAGIVYGGTLDAVTGVLTVSWTMVDFGNINWLYNSQYKFFYSSSQIADKKPGTINIKSDMFRTKSGSWSGTPDENALWGNGTNGTIYVQYPAFTSESAADFIAYVTGHQLLYELANPITYQIDPIALYTALGHNGFSADSGAVTVEYYPDTKLYIQKMISTGNNRTTGTAIASTIKKTKEPEAEESDDN